MTQELDKEGKRVIDVKHFLNEDKLDVQFVKGLNPELGVGTVVSVGVVSIKDQHSGQDKELLELKIDFVKLDEVRSFLCNQTSIVKLRDVFGSDALSWIGRQVYPMVEIWQNNRAGVVLSPVTKSGVS